MLIELTSSQLMALKDLIIEHLRCPKRTDVYVDVCAQVETTPEDLLAALVLQDPV